ncbi:MAG: S8 family peptidase, partial [candidate division WOR-3 bacterium]
QEQAELVDFLKEQQAAGRVADIRPLWIVNAVYCEATPEVIRAVAERQDVNYVNYDLVWCPDLLEQPGSPAEPTDEITWGVRKIRAPEVWAQGYTGAGVVCGHIDTGCDYTHPDLADHMWEDPNYPYHGWNFENNNNNPMDAQGHGTHTAGTVASDGTSGTQCGVAPDARIMACRVRTVVDSVAESQCWQAMQFVVSPPLSPGNGADLYTMSLGWMISWNPHQATWRQVADNVNAAGVIQIVAAGNERGTATPPTALRCPGNVPPPWWNPQNTGSGTLSGIISIGATDSLDAIAYFSSPGPVTWQTVAPYNDYVYPPGLTKPDVSAPGVAVISCQLGGGYVSMDGTSMATPHTAGTVCLMLSKNPNLTPAVVDSILEVTAVDLGSAGKDNDFGAGRIDA